MSATIRCPECGGDNPRQVATCWLCGAPLGDAAKPPEPVAATLVAPPLIAEPDELAPPSTVARAVPSPPTAAGMVPRQFQLSTLLLWVTVICISLGLMRIGPGLVVFLLIAAVPALVRSLAVANRATAGGAPMATGTKIGAFFTSVLIVILVLLAGAAAFCAACFAALLTSTGKELDNLGILLGAGSLASIVVMAAIFIALWPRAK